MLACEAVGLVLACEAGGPVLACDSVMGRLRAGPWSLPEELPVSPGARLPASAQWLQYSLSRIDRILQAPTASPP